MTSKLEQTVKFLTRDFTESDGKFVYQVEIEDRKTDLKFSKFAHEEIQKVLTHVPKSVIIQNT